MQLNQLQSNLVIFQIFKMFYNCYLYLLPKLFHHFKIKPNIHDTFFYPVPTLSLQQPPIYIVSIDLPILDISYICNYIICDLLCSSSFSQYNVSKTYLHCFMDQYFLTFYGCKIFHFIPQLVKPVICYWTFELFHLLAIVMSASKSMLIHVFFEYLF